MIQFTVLSFKLLCLRTKFHMTPYYHQTSLQERNVTEVMGKLYYGGTEKLCHFPALSHVQNWFTATCTMGNCVTLFSRLCTFRSRRLRSDPGLLRTKRFIKYKLESTYYSIDLNSYNIYNSVQDFSEIRTKYSCPLAKAYM